MWESFLADMRLYRLLRFQQRSASWQAALACLHSRGLLILAMQRLNRYIAQSHRAKGWTAKTLLLRIFAGVCRPPMVWLTKAEILSSVDIGSGIYFSDLGHVVIGAKSIGAGTIIHHRVTAGMSLMDKGRPTIGSDVWIGPDCVIYGNISIGDGATLLPGSALTKSIPPKSVVHGNPARIVRLDFDNTQLRNSTNWSIDAAAIR